MSEMVPAAMIDGIWQALEEGARNRRSPAHTPVVATVDEGGAPDQRVMVLRAVDRVAATLRFHTDARSPKTAQLATSGTAHVLIYLPDEKLQLRLSGTARVVREGLEVDAVWAASTRFARRCYLAGAAPGTALAAPGSGLPLSVEGREPDDGELIPARANFAVVMVDVARIDWLRLANSGHRRAVFERNGDAWVGHWVVP